MAKSRFLLTLSFYVLIPSILCRSLISTESHNTNTKTVVLDVLASIQQALKVLSHEPTKHEGEDVTIATTTSSSSSLLSLTLHPRSSLIRPTHKDYKSLVLARLRRDSARVASLTTKLQLALQNITFSDFKPVETVVQPEDLQSPVTSGVSQGSGEYFTRVGLGQPAKPFYMVIDTGSDVNWLQCEPCSECYQQSDQIFSPSGSSTYKPLSCDSQQCSSLEVSACRAGTCLYQVSYGDGSYTIGDFATETLSFGSSGSIPNVAIGCGHDNEGLFIGSAGILGLGGGSLSLPSQVKVSSFSYCLVDRDSGSSSTLEFNSPRPTDSVTAPMLRNSRLSTFFYVGLTGINVAGDPVSIPPSTFKVDDSGKGGIIIDSGTAVTRLQTQAYDSLRDAFVKRTQHMPSASGFALFDTCYDLSSMTKVSVPTVSFNFGDGQTLPLHPKSYLIPVDSAGKYCFAFAPSDGSPSIIGNVQQQGTRVSYDLANKVVGFSPDKC